MTGESATHQWVYAFEDGDGSNKQLLGGKGANLCEMTQIGINVPPGFVITTEACLEYLDGNRLPELTFGDTRIEGEAIVKGDDKVPAISAASIIAKTTRDGIMEFLDRMHPEYGFARHKGYGTEIHRARLQEFGPCEHHRYSFAPVRAAS